MTPWAHLQEGRREMEEQGKCETAVEGGKKERKRSKKKKAAGSRSSRCTAMEAALARGREGQPAK